VSVEEDYFLLGQVDIGTVISPPELVGDLVLGVQVETFGVLGFDV
jgi:hypothetical protein